MTQSSIVRSGITLFPYSAVSPAVSLYLDHVGGYRLHTGEEDAGFRGYASECFGEWRVRAWCKVTGFRFERDGYKTENGAVRALTRAAASIQG